MESLGQPGVGHPGPEALPAHPPEADWQDGEGWKRADLCRALALLYGEPAQPGPRRPLPLEADLRILQPPPSTHKLHLTHCGVTDALRPNLLLGKC